jgi:hypothetical protein
VIVHECIERLPSVGVGLGVDVEDDQSVARCDCDVGVWASAPPFGDDGGVGRCVFTAVSSAKGNLLPGLARKDADAVFGVAERGF